MIDLFTPNPTDSLLPYDGQLYDFGLLHITDVTDSIDALYHTLLTTLPWQPDTVKLFGKTHTTRRQIVWMGDKGLQYRYSGHTHRANGWYPLIFTIKQVIEQAIQVQFIMPFKKDNQEPPDADALSASLINHGSRPNYFNACLLNYYPSGSEGMGYHADDEPELGATPLIASLSLGATRKMAFKHKPNKHKTDNHRQMPDKVELYLASGQLIMMAGVTQQYWKHRITKTTTVNEGRISLTFRHIQPLRA